MLQKIIMPKLGDTMEEGIIANWIVEEGDTVKKGDTIMEIETDKATMEVESFVEGIVLKIISEEGQTVPVGAVVGYVGNKDDLLPEETTGTSEINEPNEVNEFNSVKSENITRLTVSNEGRKRASPRAADLASKLNIDISEVIGSGPKGRVTSKDVQDFQDSRNVQPVKNSKGRLIPLNRLGKLTAEKMLISRQTIPCFDLTIEIRMDKLMILLKEHKLRSKNTISIHDTLIKASSIALNEYPILTGKWTDEGILIADNICIGLAVALDDGLVAPVVKKVNNRSLIQIASQTHDLIQKARAGQLKPDDLTDACITISNLGMLGIDAFTPIVIPGQSSIIGIGMIKETPVINDGKVIPVKIMNLTLSVDHRLTDGAYAARFLGLIKDSLENPEQLFN